MTALWVLLASTPGCGEPETGCNGDDALCDRAYDEVAYLTTHNAFSTEVDGFAPPNQTLTLTEQLELGVRGFMLDVYFDERRGVTSLCHAACVFGRRPLVDGLAEIEAFLARHRREVVTIIFESYVDADTVWAELEASGLARRVFVPTTPNAWPTLREMIEADARVVVLTDRDGGAIDGYLDVWAYAWETHFSAETPDDFSCAPNRGDTSNSLFIFNHFLTAPFASPSLAEQVNHDPLLSDRIAECRAASGDFPNFITVDFVEIGDALAATHALNERDVE